VNGRSRRRPSSARDRRASPVARALVAGVLVVTAALLPVARAQDRHPPAEAHLRYLIEKAACDEGTADRDREACLRDAAAAYAEARKGVLESGEGSFERNALQRCDALRGDDREDCIARIRGQGTTSGSVEGGGLYREIRTLEIGPTDR
jgi:hypothetical protein